MLGDLLVLVALAGVAVYWRAATGIVLQAIAAAVFYGVLHDLVTAHLCVEYFTVAHPFVFPSDDPVVMALLWGVLATWWVGLLLGIPLALAARAGSRPKLGARDLRRPIGRLLLIMALSALIAGFAGFTAAEAGWIWLVPPLDQKIPLARHSLFLFAGFAHAASYLVGLVGGMVLVVGTWRRRA